MRARKLRWLWVFALLGVPGLGCGDDGNTLGDGNSSGGTSGSGGSGGQPTCTPSAQAETSCTGGVDDDCDGYIDCLDPECEAVSCGNGLSCTAGACLQPCNAGDACLGALGQIDNLTARVRGDTLFVDFSAVDGARDYRIYPYPNTADILVGQNGEVAVKNAIYRCAGDRPRKARETDGLNAFDRSLSGDAVGYSRQEADSLLGYVYLTPGMDRDPVYRVANPDLNSGYVWPYQAPPGQEFSGAEYVTDTATRDSLLAQRWRDDGIAFYVPKGATKPLYSRVYTSNDGALVFYTNGPEKNARAGDADSTESQHFKLLDQQEPGSVPLYRIFYGWGGEHDVLAAGEADKERLLNQGNQPVTTLVWPGVKAQTNFVIEALDNGCPFPGGYVGAISAPATDLGGIANYPTLTLDQARLSSGEVFVNGQHDPNNRPKPIARAFVSAAPEPHPQMDWFMSFDDDQPLASFDEVYADGNQVHILHNDKLSIEFAIGTTENYSYGQLLNQFVAGSAASFSLSARGANAQLSDSSYLHVTMAADIPSTFRRYPQIMITDAPLDPPSYTNGPTNVLIVDRLGPRSFEMAPPGQYHTIIAQVFGPYPELQVQFCDLEGWGVSDQCPKANIYGYHAGTDQETWDAPWLPIPAMGDYVGVDRPVKFDVYASTNRVYMFVEDRPAGCAVLPAGRMPAGGVNVIFGIAAYHIEIDEGVEPTNAEHQYWQRYSLSHTDRRLDDLGIQSGVAAPAWDESVLPCGDRFYANGL